MNDAISRGAVLETLCNGCNSRNNTPVPRCGDMCTDFKEVLKIPALDVAPVVHARWIAHSDNVLGTSKECSNCSEEYFDEYDMCEVIRYCPNCGARMDGDADGTHTES